MLNAIESNLTHSSLKCIPGLQLDYQLEKDKRDGPGSRAASSVLRQQLRTEGAEPVHQPRLHHPNLSMDAEIWRIGKAPTTLA